MQLIIMKNIKTKSQHNLIVLLIALLFICHLARGQNNSKQPLKSGWERIHVRNLGSFDLPPTMEIQEGRYKEFIDQRNKIKGFDSDHITAQQAGLNEFGDQGFQGYARVILQTTMGQTGDYAKLNFEIPEMSKSELDELNKYFRDQVEHEFIGSEMNLIDWYPIKFRKINGMSCMHISYNRQLNDSPKVLVDTYNFHNNDRLHSLTLAYRIRDAEFWKSDFEKILSSFKIINIK